MRADLKERLTRSVGDRYKVEDEIGRGGMATVFVAEDLKHRRRVAVKVLHPELTAALGAERFLREIEIVAGLQHPHIVPLYDSGKAEGLLYYLMPFVEGESLGERLARDGSMPVDEALRLSLEVAGALDYAHRAGVVHRDIKPDNIMLSGGHALVTDFGIATAVRTAGGEGLTRTGMSVGTPTYMSPEQVEGDRELDGRSDLYGLGCVLYEMLSGRPPYVGSSPLAILAKQVKGERARLDELRSDVPPGVEDVIARALARDPTDRYADAGEFAAALKEAPSAPPTPRPRDSERSIAVLPFRNMSTDPEREYFGDGMAEDVINALGRLPSLRVAARTSSFAFKGRDEDVREVGKQLGVATVLEGSVRHAGDRVRLTVQLISVTDGYQLWSGRVDRKMTDIFEIQDELTSAIVDQLKVELAPALEAEPLVQRGTDDPEAYQAYMKGRHAWNQRELPQAIEHFQAAIARDPGFAAPYAGLADSFTILASYGFMPSADALAKASGAAQKAVALAPDLGEGHFSLGVVAGVLGWDVDLGVAELRRALELNPRLGIAHAFLSLFLAARGEGAKAREQARKAHEMEPLSPLIAYLAGWGLVWARHYDTAVEVLQKGIEIDPEYGPVLWALGAAYMRQGMHREAGEALDRVGPALSRTPWLVMLRGELLARSGREEEARQLLRSLEDTAREAYVPAVTFAWILIPLGEIDEAVEYLEQAYVERNVQFAWIAGWEGFEAVLSSPHYLELLDEAGASYLANAWAERP